MQAATLRAGNGLVDGLLGEGVAEPVPHRPALAQYRSPQHLQQGRHALLGVEICDPSQHEFVGGHRQHRGGLHHRHRLRGQASHPRGHRLPQSARHHRLAEPGRWIDHLDAQVSPASLLTQGDQVLLDHQGQARTALEQDAAQRVSGARAQGGSGQVVDVGFGQRSQMDLRAAGARRAAIGRTEDRLTYRQLLVPVGEHQAELRWQVAGQEQQQLAGGFVHPVQILDDQDRGAAGLQDRARRPYQLVALGPGRLHVGGSGRQVVGQLRQQRRQGAGQWGDLGGRRQVGAGLAQGIDDRPVGERFAQRVAGSVQDPPAPVDQVRGHLADQAGLADPGFPLDQHHCGWMLQGSPQETGLPSTAHEGETAAACGAGTGIETNHHDAPSRSPRPRVAAAVTSRVTPRNLVTTTLTREARTGRPAERRSPCRPPPAYRCAVPIVLLALWVCLRVDLTVTAGVPLKQMSRTSGR